MNLSYYDAEKLMKITYDQKLSSSLRRMEAKRIKAQAGYAPSRELTRYRSDASGAIAKQNTVVFSKGATWTRNN